jgi:hypothetical protein
MTAATAIEWRKEKLKIVLPTSEQYLKASEMILRGDLEKSIIKQIIPVKGVT